MPKPPSELDTLLCDTVTALDYDYVGCEYFQQSRSVILRLYAEKRDGHITIGECANISRQVNAVLAVEGNLPESYTLEVSSPGLERPLFNADQFMRFLGKTVKVRAYHALNGQRNFVGVIKAADQEQLTLDVAGQPIELAMSNIDKARLVVEFDV